MGNGEWGMGNGERGTGNISLNNSLLPCLLVPLSPCPPKTSPFHLGNIQPGFENRVGIERDGIDAQLN